MNASHFLNQSTNSNTDLIFCIDDQIGWLNELSGRLTFWKMVGFEPMCLNSGRANAMT